MLVITARNSSLELNLAMCIKKELVPYCYSLDLEAPMNSEMDVKLLKH